MTRRLLSTPGWSPLLRLILPYLLATCIAQHVYPKEREYLVLPHDENTEQGIVLQFSHTPDNSTFLDVVDTLQVSEAKRIRVPRYFKTFEVERLLDELKLYNEQGERWSERVILEVLYYSLLYGTDHDPKLGQRQEGDRTQRLEIAIKWMDDKIDVCEWEGITCGEVPRELPHKERRYNDHMISPTHPCNGVPNGVVTIIDLREYGLKGRLPTELSDLVFLERLLVSRNYLNGTIPDTYGKMRGLSLLDLSDNELTGTLPKSLTRLSSTLEELWLETNQLEGPFHEEMRKLTRLRYIDIGENHLTGTLPTGLAELTKLVAFFGEENKFHGQLPTEYSGLPLLRVLDVDSCNITGTIPTEYGLMSNLVEIFVQGNRITGTFPEELLQLRQLEFIFIDENEMTGSLPSGDQGVYSWSNLRNVREFMLSRNSFTGTISHAIPRGLSSLTAIDMGFNEFSGTLPTELGLLTDLNRLNLRSNKLRGTVPSEFGLFENLRVLGLSDNRLTGEIPEVVCDLDWYFKQYFGCDSILCPPETFHVEGAASWQGGCRPCPLTEEEIAADPGLTKILGRSTCRNETFVNGDVDGDGVLSEWEILLRLFTHTDGENWGPQFESWLEWDNTACDLPGVTCTGGTVTKVDLTNGQMCSDGNGNEGSAQSCYGIPSELGLLSNLEVLNFPRHHFLRGTLPTELGLLAKLSYLEISGGMVEGTLPSEIGLLTNLRILNLQNCNLHGSIPTELFSLSRLENLSLGINSFTGTIPTELGALVSAKEISISRCLLHGTIPSSIGQLSSSAENIEIYSNRLSGTLPTELGACTILRRFDAFNNMLSGTIPESLGTMKGLQVLHLKKNVLTGTLPSLFGDLPQLLWLDLTSNKIHGTIPSSYSETSTLKDLRLGDNRIYNPIPLSLCSSRAINGGRPDSLGCDSILCPRGTFSTYGFASDQEPCKECPDDQTSVYLGATSCVTVYEEDVLAMFYDVLHGENWPEQYKHGWKNDHIYYCNWGGIVCFDDEIIGINFPIMASDPPKYSQF